MSRTLNRSTRRKVEQAKTMLLHAQLPQTAAKRLHLINVALSFVQDALGDETWQYNMWLEEDLKKRAIHANDSKQW